MRDLERFTIKVYGEKFPWSLVLGFSVWLEDVSAIPSVYDMTACFLCWKFTCGTHSAEHETRSYGVKIPRHINLHRSIAMIIKTFVYYKL